MKDNVCSICLKEYKTIEAAFACKIGHELIYVPLTKEDLGRLIQFLYTKNEEILTESLVKTLQKYNKIRPSRDIVTDI